MRTTSVVAGFKALLRGVDVTHAPGVPVTDAGDYYTTVQPHSFDGPLVGEYFRANGTKAFDRDDGAVSFHWLDSGPDASRLVESAFRARWSGRLVPDCDAANVTFRFAARGGVASRATVTLDGAVVATWNASLGTGSKRVIQRRFNVGVLGAIPKRKASTL